MHCSLILDTKLFVFGGITKNGLANSDMYILELDELKS